MDALGWPCYWPVPHGRRTTINQGANQAQARLRVARIVGERPDFAVGTVSRATIRALNGAAVETSHRATSVVRTVDAKMEASARATAPTARAMARGADVFRKIPSGPRTWAASLVGKTVQAFRGLAGVIFLVVARPR